jgi:two-component system chemotaxis response regulator CheB
MAGPDSILVIAGEPLLRKTVTEVLTTLADGASVEAVSSTRATPDRILAAGVVVLVAADREVDDFKGVLDEIAAAGRPLIFVSVGDGAQARAIAARLGVPGRQTLTIPELNIRDELERATTQFDTALRSARAQSKTSSSAAGMTPRPVAPSRPSTLDPISTEPPGRPPISTLPPVVGSARTSDAGVPYLGVVICIGSSTGGTDALQQVLSGLDRNCAPVVVVQHMPADYVGDFAARLDQACRIDVNVARDDLPLRRGMAVIAPGGRQLRLRKDAKGIWTRSGERERFGGHCPAVDVLMTSAAEQLSARAIGVILTGMGRDGSDGLLAMRKTGARTAAQDEETSVVYGMPKAAFEDGAADTVLPLRKVANWVAGMTMTLER